MKLYLLLIPSNQRRHTSKGCFLPGMQYQRLFIVFYRQQIDDMVQFYPSLFTAHLLGSTLASMDRPSKAPQVKNNNHVLPMRSQPFPAGDQALFSVQKQFLDMVTQSGLFRPGAETVERILSYARHWEKGNPVS